MYVCRMVEKYQSMNELQGMYKNYGCISNYLNDFCNKKIHE